MNDLKQKKDLNSKEELILGIDDAGRGPLIGPMALAGCLITKQTEKEFRKADVKDSKLILPKKRESLAKKIKKESLDYHVCTVSAKEIDSKIKSGTNLNKIEAIKAAEIINKITDSQKKNQKIRVIIDCPSINKKSWRLYVLKDIIDSKKKNLIIQCEHKADRDHIAVGAASILAKSEREKQVAKIKKKIGKDFGSGYPSDPMTKEFLKKYAKKFNDSGIFRKTWATFKNHKKEKEQKNIMDF